MPQNDVLIRLRKHNRLHQKELGMRVAEVLGNVWKESYAQRKVSLWESLQAKPSPNEVDALAGVLNGDREIIAESFSGQMLALDPSTLIEGIRLNSPAPALIATCAGSQTRPQLLDEIEGALRPALEDNLHLAIFFPYPLRVEGAAESSSIIGVAGLYMHAWTTLLNFYTGLRARLDETTAERVALYRPKRTIEIPANILIPPMLRRSTLAYQYIGKELRRALYVWTQSDRRDLFYEVEATSPDIFDQQNLETQINAWEWYFGSIVSEWKQSKKFVQEDIYWTRF